MALRSIKPFKYNFASPYFFASIISPISANRKEAVRTPLWTNLQLRSESLLRVDQGLSSLPFVQSAAVELQLGDIAKIIVVLTPPFRDAQKFLSSELMEWGLSRLECQFGYTGGAPEGVVLSPVFSGMILQPQIQLGTDVSVTLTAMGDGGWQATNTAAVGTAVPEKQSRKEIINTLMKGPDGKRRVEKVDYSEAERDSDCYYLLNNDPVGFVASGETEWFHIRQLAREARCYIMMTGNTLYLLPRTLKSEEPGRTFTFYDHSSGKISPAKQVFPILSISSPTVANFLNSSARDYLLRDINANKEDDKQPISDTEAKLGYTDANGTITPPTNPDTPGAEGTPGSTYPVGSPSDSATYNKGVSSLDTSKLTNGINVTVTSLGIPDLQPGEVVEVRGVFSRLDSNYAILTVKHSLDSSGYQTEFTGISNVGQIATLLPAEYQGAVVPIDQAAVAKYRQASELEQLQALGSSNLSEIVEPTSAQKAAIKEFDIRSNVLNKAPKAKKSPVKLPNLR